MLTRLLVRPGTNFSFTRRNSSEDFGCDKTVAKEETADLIAKIDALQFTLVDHKDVLINLHVSKDEQRVRLQSRVDDPTKRWKFRTGDLDDRKLWPQLMKADEVAFSETSTENAPWFVVPTDRKWVRDLCVARIVHDALVTMNPVLLPDDPTIAGTVVV